MSSNGYASLEDLEGLCGLRQYEDVVIQHPASQQPLKFRIQSITEAEWAEISSGNFDTKRGGLSARGLQQSDARLVAASLVDGDGNLLLRGSDAVSKVSQLGASIVEPLVRACRELNNLRAAEDEEGNSPAGSGSDSSSAELAAAPTG